MEPYIPLVKAIIISTMFSWGTSSVTITDKYILKETNHINERTGKETKDYQIYDMYKNVNHLVDHNKNYQTLFYLDSIEKEDPSELSFEENNGNPNIKVVEIKKEKYEDYSCKVEKRTMEVSRNGLAGPVIEISDHSYFAKIPWMDSVLDTDVKREFAGFERQEYSPYHYLIHEFIQYPEQASKDIVLRIIEKSEVDTILIHTLLSLPVKKN